jgi:hypothetical protein
MKTQELIQLLQQLPPDMVIYEGTYMSEVEEMKPDYFYVNVMLEPPILIMPNDEHWVGPYVPVVDYIKSLPPTVNSRTSTAHYGADWYWYHLEWPNPVIRENSREAAMQKAIEFINDKYPIHVETDGTHQIWVRGKKGDLPLIARIVEVE